MSSDDGGHPHTPGIHGAAVVDKPRGPTSHDVVARARKALGTRRVGHAGTLDPMATGVLVILAGEATKLAPYVTAHDKRYLATIKLGVGTDSLDADGAVVAEADVPAWLVEELDAIDRAGAAPHVIAALDAERARKEQTPPAFSAIKVGGERSYDRARKGEEVELVDRAVEVLDLRARGASVATFELHVELAVSKGYYVRSLARDLGLSLGVPAHLTALRRIASGPFRIEEAVATLEPASLAPLASVAERALGAAELTPSGATRARHGKTLDAGDFSRPPPDGSPCAWLASGELVAVGERRGDEMRVLRGFS